MAFEEGIWKFLSWLLPPWFVTIIISTVPFVELRGALPYAYFVAGLPLAQAFVLSVIGNMLPVPVILYLFRYIERWLRRWSWWDRGFDRLFERTRKRYKRWFKRHGDVAIIVFVGIPLPFTGAWTGSLIAYLFDMKVGRAIYIIFVGVWMAGVVVSAICLSAAWLLGF